MLDSLRILGKTYQVVAAQAGPLGSSFKGQVNCCKQLIHVDVDSAADHIAETLLHECIHVLDYDMQLELTERQVHALGAGVLMLLNDNPGLRKLLLRGHVDEVTT